MQIRSTAAVLTAKLLATAASLRPPSSRFRFAGKRLSDHCRRSNDPFAPSATSRNRDRLLSSIRTRQVFVPIGFMACRLVQPSGNGKCRRDNAHDRRQTQKAHRNCRCGKHSGVAMRSKTGGRQCRALSIQWWPWPWPCLFQIGSCRSCVALSRPSGWRGLGSKNSVGPLTCPEGDEVFAGECFRLHPTARPERPVARPERPASALSRSLIPKPGNNHTPSEAFWTG